MLSIISILLDASGLDQFFRIMGILLIFIPLTIVTVLLYAVYVVIRRMKERKSRN